MAKAENQGLESWFAFCGIVKKKGCLTGSLF
jgi:hypothetical protein